MDLNVYAFVAIAWVMRTIFAEQSNIHDDWAVLTVLPAI